MRVTTRSVCWFEQHCRDSNDRDMGRRGGNCYAQNDPNPGALTFTGGTRLPDPVLLPRHPPGSDPKLTLWPYGDLGIALFSRRRRTQERRRQLRRLEQPAHRSLGQRRPERQAALREDFYTTLALGFGGGVGLGTTYTAYTSPNEMFTTVKELSFKVSKAHMLAPYGMLAFEIGGDESGQADGGQHRRVEGTYLELGVGPSWPLGDGIATLAVPVKMGLSLRDYYERLDENGVLTDDGFGFFDIGGLVTFPLTGVPSSSGPGTSTRA